MHYEEQRFEDALYDWMQRAPWLALSAAAHALVLLVLMAIPWGLLRSETIVEIWTDVERPVEDPFDVPPPPDVPDIVPTDPVEPTLVDNSLPPIEDAPTAAAFDGPSDLASDTAMDDAGLESVIGLGPGALGARLGGRFGRDKYGRGGGRTEPALEAGLRWLASHQAPDGSWDCDGFEKQCGAIGAERCTGPGEAPHDVGATGLALLAFLGDGNTASFGPYREVVARGIAWLVRQQDPDTRLLGDRLGHGYMYSHSIATLALCEAWYFTRNPLIKRPAQNAVALITRARNPYSAWRYDYLPSGENDTSVTGWMVFALKSAEEGGLTIDPEAYVGALSWIDEATDPATGRVGYDSTGSLSSRIVGLNEHYPPESGEAMTAVGLLCRFFIGQTPEKAPIMTKHADLLLEKLPEWDPRGLGNDMYYWYYGSYAMYQMGGKRHWNAWNKALERTLLGSQRRDGDAAGSWDPDDAWGFSGGRVVSTALMVLTLEVYFRYGRVAGMR